MALAGCRQDMHDAPRYDPLESSAIFPNGASAQPLVEGTVARGFLADDELLNTGKVSGQAVNEFPFAMTKADIDRGQQRFNIYCTPCHGRTGEGNGMVVQRGYRQPPSYHTDRLRQAPAGYFFDVMTNGFGVMPDYRAQVTVEDRWRIVAYIRALQLSHQGTVADVPAADRARLESGEAEAPAAGAEGHAATEGQR
jgi:mono/diheme cytochrome c family protein